MNDAMQCANTIGRVRVGESKGESAGIAAETELKTAGLALSQRRRPDGIE